MVSRQSAVCGQSRLRVHRQGPAAGRQDQEDRAYCSLPCSCACSRPAAAPPSSCPTAWLFGSSKAHRTLRKILVEEQKLDAIVSMPSGVFRPYAGVSTAILLFTKTNSGGTDDVWFYDMQADGYSLDDKRTPQPEKSDLVDILARWQHREAERKRGADGPEFPRA